MHFIFVSYNHNPDFNSPQEWIKRISFYIPSLEILGENHQVSSLQQIGYEGDYRHNNIQYHFKKLNNPYTHFPGSLNRFIKQLNPDVVVIHGTHYPLQVLQLRLLLPKSVKIIVQP